MPYAVNHFYRYDAGRRQGVVFLCLKQGLTEAITWVETQYRGREMPGRDWVLVQDETGKELFRLEVDYMPMYEVLDGMTVTARSKSNPGKTYTAQVNTNGILSCQCPAWTKGFKKMDHHGHSQPYRHCTHTDQLKGKYGFETKMEGQYLLRVDPKIKAAKSRFAGATGPAQKFAILVKEYEEAIAVMAALDPNEMYQAAAMVEQAKFKVECYMALLETHGIDGSPQFLAAEAKLKEVVARG